jgi:hypothetical protein
MTGRMVLRLSADWAVLADDRQWMLCRRRKNANSGWKPLSYVASSKAVLLRCLREKGAVVDAQGQAALDALPESFRQWRQEMAEPAFEAPVSEPATARHARKWGVSGAGDAAQPTSRPVLQIPPVGASAETREKEALR